MKDGHIWIIEEVPGIEEYRWFVTASGLALDDPIRLEHFKESKNGRAFYFGRFDEAEGWCKQRGLSFKVKRFEA